MDVDAIVAQLRAEAPAFAGNVAGAADFDNGVRNQTWLPTPAAYVIPADEQAEENTSSADLRQVVHENVEVIVALDTAYAGGALDIADRRGQKAAASLMALRAAIFRAILNWRPANASRNGPGQNAARGIYYLGARYPSGAAFDRARFFYSFMFGLDTLITGADGWQLSGEPLVSVRGRLVDQVDGAELATAEGLEKP